MNYGKGAALGQVNSVSGHSIGGETAVRESEVQQQMAALERTIHSLADVCGDLHNRAATVARPIAQLAESNKVAPQSVLVPLASRLRDMDESAARTLNALRELVQAIEL